MRPVHSVLLASLLVGCGAGATESPAPKTSPKATAAATVAPLPSAPYTLKRSQVKEALKAPALILRNVVLDYDHPIFAAGKFYGFRVLEVRGGPEWSAIDLKPGDVVTAVNGFGIGRPEAAGQAMETLVVASELRVDLDRGGEQRALRFAIVDD